MSLARGINPEKSRSVFFNRSRFLIVPRPHISMDFIVGLLQTDLVFNAIFTFVDRLTKYVHLMPTTSNADAREAARLYINYIFPHHGLSKSIVSDRDPKFTSAFFKAVFTILGTQRCRSRSEEEKIVSDNQKKTGNWDCWETFRPLRGFLQSAIWSAGVGTGLLWEKDWGDRSEGEDRRC